MNDFYNNIIFIGYFNLIYDSKYDLSGGNPELKKPLAKLIELKETIYLIYGG